MNQPVAGFLHAQVAEDWRAGQRQVTEAIERFLPYKRLVVSPNAMTNVAVFLDCKGLTTGTTEHRSIVAKVIG